MTFVKHFFFAFTLILYAIFSQSLLADTNKNDLLTTIQDKGVLTVGVAFLPPWVMEDNGGTLIGFEIDIANQLAKDLGVKIVFKQYQWDKMIPALVSEEIDIIASGLSITPKRALTVNFSNPYSSSGYDLVSNLSLTKDFTRITDLDSEKVSIVAVTGTVSADLVGKVFPKAKLILKANAKDATVELLSGSVHAFVSSSPVPEFVSLRFPDDVDLPLKNPLLTTKEAFAVKKGNQEMLNFLNSWIHAHDADGWINSSHKYWFSGLKWQEQVGEEK